MSQLKPVVFDHDGVSLEGLIAVPEGSGRRPGVLVMSNAHGLAKQAKERAVRLAELGYVAIATDMYGNGAHADDPAGTGDLMVPLISNPTLLRSRVTAWYETLKARPEVDPGRLAAIGFCFGGQNVLELARTGADVKAVVSYHGLLSTALPAERGAIKAQVVSYTGAKDPFAPLSDVEAFQKEMAAAEAQWHLTVFGNTYHSFTDPDAHLSTIEGLKYDPLAERISWNGTLTLLEAVF
jgi:dienelactone hydrolase